MHKLSTAAMVPSGEIIGPGLWRHEKDIFVTEAKFRRPMKKRGSGKNKYPPPLTLTIGYVPGIKVLAEILVGLGFL